jgi:hypothetical protein
MKTVETQRLDARLTPRACVRQKSLAKAAPSGVARPFILMQST